MVSTVITECAACGKEGGDSLKACTACKLVKYCNRDCQIAHRPLHKKICKKRAAELHDEALFKEHPPPEDCPICYQPLPSGSHQRTFKPCCGKRICNGCIYAIHALRSPLFSSPLPQLAHVVIVVSSVAY